MPIHFACPHCRRPLSIGRRHAGISVHCPACRRAVTVPAGSAPFGAGRPKSQPTGPALRQPNGRIIHRGIVAAAVFGAVFFVTGLVLAAPRLLRSSAASADPVAQESLSGQLLLFPCNDAPPTRLPVAVIAEAEVELPEPVIVAVPEVFVEPIGPPRVRGTITRRHLLSEEDLRKQLAQVPEVRLDADARSFGRIQATARSQNPQGTHPTLALLTSRPDLSGLPMRMGVECQAGKDAAENLQALSRKLRSLLQMAMKRLNQGDPRIDVAVLRKELLAPRFDGTNEWLDSDAVPALVQLLQAESKPARLLLVEMLARINAPCASSALVQRALFDLSPEVREAAVQALVERPRQEVRAGLLDGFRHPWAPVADHAAEALVVLQDREAVPQLVKLLRELDPRTPFLEPESRTARVRELVRVNHLGNCLMCHAPSASINDPVRGLIPTAGQPLPAPPSSSQYYSGSQGLFVRADVTYLKQDFAVPQPVDRPGPWPTSQRYDYLVRTRRPEAEDFKPRTDSPHRDAVRYALAELDTNWMVLLARTD